MLDPNIERQLSELELRHKLHKQMLEDHIEQKHIRKHRHRANWHKMKVIPIQLV